MTKTIFRGDERITDATSYLESSIDDYNKALGNLHLRIGIKTYELVKGTYFDILFAVTLVNLSRYERPENSR